ncbi:LPXTG cell wall anchor domain-containing protein [Streptococcus sp. DTU_2020_1001019_1_SI_AUS_MUR_006]|uniref:LPXTG cell wall anchor domain-containing protein n=1 Tax=Streptococcus sp. DTU_2020_1001019_1_SI_AUS_MUR_006 TaxID=3077584 RepID=UPI0028EA6BE7|nr:LPXTG cell wall anchor domain-containing protein [Streptococcus sp. DTU_2020_1001019_1_SI_AUS_MUR_006]WNS72012.1 LPXTG cell wall anchor domain-containing protein [Streptococcus sp. DTU_2020_1001019_1_SI_AUS_MUR_006]
MKTNKVTKLGVSLLSVAALGVVAPALTDVPVFGTTVVKAKERGPLEYTIAYYDKDTGEEIAPRKTGTINPGESVNIYRDIDGYQVVSNFDEWMPGFNATYRIVSENFGFSDGRLFMDLSYKKVNADAKPSEEVKPETKPSDTPKPEVKPEPNPSETPKPEVKPEPKPSDTSKPEVKPEPKPSDTPKPEVKPAPKPSETPKPEVKPEPKPSDASKPEVKPSEKPVAEAEEQQKPLKYRIDYLEKGSGGKKVAASEFGVLNPGETVNIYKDIEGFEVVSHYEWLPGYNMDYDTLSTYSGSVDGYNYMYLFYKKVKPAPKPSDTSKPEVKPEPKPSETPKPEVKPEPKPSETPKPEVKPETKPSETPKPEVKPEPKPSDTSKPEVKPELKPQTNSNTAPTAPVKPVGQTSNSKADKPTSKKETPALPNTGEQSSSLSLFGLLLASIGLAGLTYKGRH